MPDNEDVRSTTAPLGLRPKVFVVTKISGMQGFDYECLTRGVESLRATLHQRLSREKLTLPEGLELGYATNPCVHNEGFLILVTSTDAGLTWRSLGPGPDRSRLDEALLRPHSIFRSDTPGLWSYFSTWSPRALSRFETRDQAMAHGALGMFYGPDERFGPDEFSLRYLAQSGLGHQNSPQLRFIKNITPVDLLVRGRSVGCLRIDSGLVHYAVPGLDSRGFFFAHGRGPTRAEALTFLRQEPGRALSGGRDPR